jgi:gluconolactonase
MGEWVDVRWERLDERFAAVGGDRRLERIFGDGRWVEGPAYSPAWKCLLFSDIPNDRTLRWDETSGVVGVFAQPSGNANGRTIDRQGRVVTCEHGHRRVTRLEHDGSTTVLANRFEGKRLNSPNDVVERADGTVWFTDPSYGIDTDYEGDRAESEIGGCHVYRIDPDGAVALVADDFVRPNGLAFSADESQLYVVDTRAGTIRRFDVSADGGLTGGDVLVDVPGSAYDGVRLDEDGRLWVAGADGVHCFHTDGTLLGKLLLPEAASNLAFGGAKRNTLFVTATWAVYLVRLSVGGVRYPA